MFKRLPLPAAGLMLSLAALGNLIQNYGDNFRYFIGGLSLLIFVALTLKVLTDFPHFLEEMKNPVMASIFPTYSMSIMLYSTYFKPFIGNMASYIYYLGIILHLAMMIWFIIRFVFSFEIHHIYATWFLPFVGLAVASIVAPAFGAQALGRIIFYFGLIAYVILLPIVIYKAYKIGNIPAPALATNAIIASPGAILVAAYINSFDQLKPALVYGLLILTQILYFWILVQVPKLKAGGFRPSYSAFTFPFVISATALKMVNSLFIYRGTEYQALNYLVGFEELVAIGFVAYVLFRYIYHIYISPIEE